MTGDATRAGYRELDEDRYLRFQRTRLKVKGGERQRAFLALLSNSEEFLNAIEVEVEVRDGQLLPGFDGPLTEASFKEPTEDQEARMYELWRSVPPRTACRVSFWASVTLEHIRSGTISHPAWLAANGGSAETGEERVDRALYGQADAKAIDDCVRTVFRRMSGLPAARGNRSVFVNPTFGRGWWRERIVAGISEQGDAVEKRPALMKVVRRSQQYWENLVTMIVSRSSVFGSGNVQAAFINSLARHFRQHRDSPLQSAKTLKTALRRFSNLAASRELGVLSFQEIGTLADGLLDDVRRRHEDSFEI